MTTTHGTHMNGKPRFYLSGGMEYTAGEGKDWRNALQEWIECELSGEVFNPNRESERFFATRYPAVDFRKLKSQDMALYSRIASGLVDLDCGEIAERTDVVLCYWDEGAMRGAGTKGELTMARYFKKPVYMVTAMPHCDIPGWVLGCVTEIFPSFEALREFLAANRG